MAQPDDGPEELKAALERSEAEVAALRAEVLSLKRIQISPTFLPVAEPVSPGAPLDLGLGGVAVLATAHCCSHYCSPLPATARYCS